MNEAAARLAAKNPTAQKSLRKSGVILISGSREQAREWANQIAPEHITVAEDDLPFVRNAGSIFVGDYSAQAAGDYASGPNHVLPTMGQARFRGGLSVLDFVKVMTVQACFGRRPAANLRPRSNVWRRRKACLPMRSSVRVRCARA